MEKLSILAQINILIYRTTIILIAIFLVPCHVVISQNTHTLSCGNSTSEGSLQLFKKIKPQLEAYHKDFFLRKSTQKSNSNNILNAIPLKIHVISSPNGFGNITVDAINLAISNLNAIYADGYLDFFVCDGIDFITSSELTRVFIKGDADHLTRANYVPGLINIYITDLLLNESHQNICGYTDNTERKDIIVLQSNCFTI